MPSPKAAGASGDPAVSPLTFVLSLTPARAPHPCQTPQSREALACVRPDWPSGCGATGLDLTLRRHCPLFIHTDIYIVHVFQRH